MGVENGTEKTSQSGHLPYSVPVTHLDALVDRLMKPRTSAIPGLRKLSPNTYFSAKYYAITRIDPRQITYVSCILYIPSCADVAQTCDCRAKSACTEGAVSWSQIASNITLAREGPCCLGMAFCLGKFRQTCVV